MYFRQLASSTAVTPTHEISAKTSPSVVCHTHNSLFAPLAERHQDEIVTDGATEPESDTLEEKSPITPPLPRGWNEEEGPKSRGKLS